MNTELPEQLDAARDLALTEPRAAEIVAARDAADVENITAALAPPEIMDFLAVPVDNDWRARLLLSVEQAIAVTERQIEAAENACRLARARLRATAAYASLPDYIKSAGRGKKSIDYGFGKLALRELKDQLLLAVPEADVLKARPEFGREYQPPPSVKLDRAALKEACLAAFTATGKAQIADPATGELLAEVVASKPVVNLTIGA